MTYNGVFRPKPGQIDYTHIRRAPVINCVVRHDGKILLVKRNESMNFYPGYWNGISGFLDDGKPAREKAMEEVQEEAGTQSDAITNIIEGRVFEFDEPQYDKTWIVHPILIDVTSDAVKLDWEASEHRWVTIGEARNMKLMPGFWRVLETLFSHNTT